MIYAVLYFAVAVAFWYVIKSYGMEGRIVERAHKKHNQFDKEFIYMILQLLKFLFCLFWPITIVVMTYTYFK